MDFDINYNEEKNEWLKKNRGVCFDDVVDVLENNKMNILDETYNISSNFKEQRMYVVKINNYAHAVPYVINRKKKEIFLKTLYPSRLLTKKYLKRSRNAK